MSELPQLKLLSGPEMPWNGHFGRSGSVSIGGQQEPGSARCLLMIKGSRLLTVQPCLWVAALKETLQSCFLPLRRCLSSWEDKTWPHKEEVYYEFHDHDRVRGGKVNFQAEDSWKPWMRKWDLIWAFKGLARFTQRGWRKGNGLNNNHEKAQGMQPWGDWQRVGSWMSWCQRWETGVEGWGKGSKALHFLLWLLLDKDSLASSLLFLRQGRNASL